MRPAALLILWVTACHEPALPAHAVQPLPAPDGFPALVGAGPYSPRIASYELDVKVSPDAHSLAGKEVVRWKNNGVAPVSELPFHLYMNAFESEDSVFMKESHGRLRRAEKTEHSVGSITVAAITVQGSDANLVPGSRYGEDRTTLTVPLPKPVAPGEEIALAIDFTTVFPEVFARTGYAGDFLMAGQWFPKIGVLTVENGAQTWHCDTFHANSEFFADFGVYDVKLRVPSSFVVVATGVLVSASDDGQERTHVFHAEDVHDFAFMADPFMRVTDGIVRGELGDIHVRVVHRPNQAAYARRHLEAARQTLEIYGKLFGPYPWSTMTIIDPPPEAAESAGGMEYPTLVTTAGDVPPDGLHLAEQVTVHEVGHNWFQGLLASNEVDEAFLDEGLNQWANGIVLDAMFGPDASLIDTPFLRAGYDAEEQFEGDAEHYVTPIATPSYRFSSFHEYAGVTYTKTTQVMKTLEVIAGRDQVLAAVGAYARKLRFQHPTRADLFAAFKANLGGDYDWFLVPAFTGGGGVRLTVGEIEARFEKGAWSSSVLVKNVGHVPVAADVDFFFADGRRETQRFDEHADGRPWRIYRFTGPQPLVEVEVDPRDQILLDAHLMSHGWAFDGDDGASWRAAARMSYWEQTLETLVGL